MLVFCLIEQIQLTCVGLTCELHPLGYKKQLFIGIGGVVGKCTIHYYYFYILLLNQWKLNKLHIYWFFTTLTYYLNLKTTQFFLYLANLKTSIIDEISNGHCRYSCIEHAWFTIMSTTIISILFEAMKRITYKGNKEKT
jgi:hypothetical protein